MKPLLLLPRGTLEWWNALVHVWCGGAETDLTNSLNNKTCSVAENICVQKGKKKEVPWCRICIKQNELFLCVVQQQKKEKEKWFHIEGLHNRWEKVWEVWPVLAEAAGLSTLEVTLVNKLKPLVDKLKSAESTCKQTGSFYIFPLIFPFWIIFCMWNYWLSNNLSVTI